MLINSTVQQKLFQHIKSILPSHLALVDEIAEVLEISNDSAYRRIRGEKPIDLEEIQKIATHYKLSLDQFLHLQSNSFIFSGSLINPEEFSLDKWMENILGKMQFFNQSKEKHVYFLNKDLPFYQHFQIPELGAFKHFLWNKSILHNDEMRGKKFSVKDIDPACYETGKKIIDIYNQIPSTEIWNLESINSTIRQIEFYKDAKTFNSLDDAECLYSKVNELINHFEMQAEMGVKFNIGSTPKANAGSYTLFINELILGDNTFHAILDGTRVSFLNHSVLNYISTTDEKFTSYIQGSLENLIRKSTQISSTGEKERTRFFNRLRDKIKLSARL